MNKLTRKLKYAAKRGCFLIRNKKHYDVFIESEGLLGPRGLCMTKRQAVNFAYHISVSKKHKLIITN